MSNCAHIYYSMKATFSETNIISPWKNQWSEDESFPFGAVTVPFRECNQVWLLLSLRDWNTTCVHFANGCKAGSRLASLNGWTIPSQRGYIGAIFTFFRLDEPPNLADPKLIYVQQHLFMSKPMYQYKFIYVYIVICLFTGVVPIYFEPYFSETCIALRPQRINGHARQGIRRNEVYRIHGTGTLIP